MPTYPYSCQSCDNAFEVIKSLSRYDTEETCTKCGGLAQRRIARCNFMGAKDWEPSYNPAFGCVVKSKAHQREILSRYKDHGKEFIEIGNEPVENIHKHFDRQREEKRAKVWSESHEKVLHESLR